jgi:hypothetical protein
VTPTQERLLNVIQFAIGAAMLLGFVLLAPYEGGARQNMDVAAKVARGLVPYRDFVLEYPPLSLIHILPPWFITGGTDAGYDIVFIALSVITAAASGAVVAWLAGRGWSAQSVSQSVLTFLALSLAVLPVVIWRFDGLPALFTVLALAAIVAKRPGWSGVALGLGTATKLYPALLLPVVVLYYAFGRRWRSAGVAVGAFAAVVGATALGIYAVGGPDGFTFLTYQEERGIEIESVLGGLVLLSHRLFGTEATIYAGFGSIQVGSSLIEGLALPNQVALFALGISLAAGLIYSFSSDARHSPDGAIRPPTVVNYMMAILVFSMLANKVLSPQYIVWLLPIGALLPWRKALLLLVIAALTTYVFPIGFRVLWSEIDAIAVAVLNLRNLLLLVLFVWLVVPARRQMDAMLDIPPSTPAATPKTNRPMASLFRRGAITVSKRAAKVTVTILAIVRPGSPASSAR